MRWPADFDELIRLQEELGAAEPAAWSPPATLHTVAGCFVCFPRGHSGSGAADDPAWAAAALIDRDRSVSTALVTGAAGAPYRAGLLALREGPLLEQAILALPHRPELLLVNATGRDHHRRAGLALHLGAVLDLPSVGVTHRPLLATGDWPELILGARAPLTLSGTGVGYWLCTQTGKRPLAVHAAWRTTPEVAAMAVLGAVGRRSRTPEPLRQAQRLARQARADAALT